MPDTAIDFSQLESVEPGDKLVVVFQARATDDLVYVSAMCSAGVLELPPGDRALVDAIRMTADWEHDENRNMTFTAGPNWSREFFEGRMRRALESLEVRPRN